MLNTLLDKISGFPSTGRTHMVIGDYFFKVYTNYDEALYEYKALKELSDRRIITFTVSKPLKLITREKKTILVASRMKGHKLRKYVMLSEIKGDNIMSIFQTLGTALRELHMFKLGGLKRKQLPITTHGIIEASMKLANTLTRLGFLDLKSLKLIERVKAKEIDPMFLKNVTLHGEFHFAHIMLMNNYKFSFLDFHEISNGPAYYDLATFSNSLYCSLMPIRIETYHAIIEYFLKGYFQKLSKELLLSLSLFEMYMGLYSAYHFIADAYVADSKRSRLIAHFRTKKIRKAIGESILLVPNKWHKELSIKLLEDRKDVWCEKPARNQWRN